MEMKEHRARITWSEAQVRQGLPRTRESVDPAWFGAGEEPWSLRCHFELPPAQQGNPSEAHIGFVLPEAPHERLAPGVALHLFERATAAHALVEVLE
jgi:hypothetical protein